MNWLAQAPANIALIKYMGKKEGSTNLPDNSSLSYTLNNLLTTVKIQTSAASHDQWEPLLDPNQPQLSLSTAGQQRYLQHLQRIKSYYTYTGNLLIQSGNNFPHSSGLASSASSFAALTRCAVLALSELTQKEGLSTDLQAKISRAGSGSSCRSFYTPWALWTGDTVDAINLPYMQLDHQVIVISNKEKTVSSSEAHQRVKTSPLYLTRNARAEENLKQLLDALQTQDWSTAYQICWREFQDMHDLFSSCTMPFSYITEASNQLLNQLRSEWDRVGDGPLITMDAGPNIHLLYRPDQKELAQQIKRDYLIGHYDVL